MDEQILIKAILYVDVKYLKFRCGPHKESGTAEGFKVEEERSITSKCI
jgi:hypothetical protein